MTIHFYPVPPKYLTLTLSRLRVLVVKSNIKIMAEQLTHFRKNLDPRYISGEDLQFGPVLNHGLRPEMVVQIEKFEDAPTYDMVKKADATKSGLWLKDIETGKPIYKPLILNNTNAKFCASEFNSPFLEHWIGKPMVLWAMPDKRFGFVARLKKYYPPAAITPDNALSILNAAEKTSDGLNEAWGKLSAAEKKLPAVVGLVAKLKGEIAK